MYQIKEQVKTKIIINKSEFITILTPISSIDEINSILSKIKSEYKDATHYCYAYIFNSLKKSSDDKEPSGTAGTPILDTISKNDLTNILCVVVRYFGGIKLGASGLIRAYSKSASTAIKEATLLKVIPSKIYKIEFEYTNSKKIDNLLKDEQVIKKEYGNTISYETNIYNEELIVILKQLCSNITYVQDSSILK